MKTADAADALASLQSFYMECINQGTFGRVMSVAVNKEGDFTATPNQHINVITDDAVNVELPTTVSADYFCCYNPVGDYGWPLDECAYYGVGYDSGQRMPRDRSVVMVTDQFGTGRATYIYDGTIQRWMRVDTLVLNDEAPLSARGADGLASVLAMRLSEEFGSGLLSPMTMQSAIRYKMALVNSHGVGDDGFC